MEKSLFDPGCLILTNIHHHCAPLKSNISESTLILQISFLRLLFPTSLPLKRQSQFLICRRKSKYHPNRTTIWLFVVCALCFLPPKFFHHCLNHTPLSRTPLQTLGISKALLSDIVPTGKLLTVIFQEYLSSLIEEL